VAKLKKKMMSNELTNSKNSEKVGINDCHLIKGSSISVKFGISLKKALIFYDLIGVLCLFQLLTARITSKLTPKKSK
jgi:hypothetical protein